MNIEADPLQPEESKTSAANNNKKEDLPNLPT